MESFTYINPTGDYIIIAYNNPQIKLLGYDGLTAPEIMPETTQGYNQNGYSLKKNKLGSRYITIDFLIYGSDMANFYELRKEVGSVFNPLLGEGLLKYTNDYASYCIKCTPTLTPYPIEKNANLQQFQLELTAFNPFFYPAEPSNGFYDIIAPPPLTMLDEALIIDGGSPSMLIPGYTIEAEDEIISITNTGDVPAPFTVSFAAGQTSPQIYLDTGEKIEVETGITDEVTVCTEYGKNIAVDGSGNKNLNLITEDSTFFLFPVGTFNLNCGGVCTIHWKPYFVGV